MSEENQNIHTEIAETHAGTENAHPVETENESGLLTINGTLIVIIVSFIIFIILMQKIFYGPITEIRNKRNEYLKKLKTESDKAFLESQNLETNYKKDINETHKKVSDIISEKMTEATEEKNKLIEEKKQEVGEFLDGRKVAMQGEEERVAEELKQQTADYARMISEKILGEEISMTGISPKIIEKAFNQASTKR